MSWALEEYIEDAIKAYLDGKVPNSMKVYVAWSDEELEFPCVVVHAGESDNVGATEFNGIRAVDVELAIMTEAAAVGGVSARNRNRVARDAVMEALAQPVLRDDLNALNPAGVEFSYAVIGVAKRAVEPDKRMLTTVITLGVIASPKELP